MVDVIEVPAPAVDVSGNLTIVWVTGVAPTSAVTAAAVTAGNRLTYSFIPGGWAPTATQEVTKDARKSLPQDLEALGKITAGVTLQYVDSVDAASASVILAPGTVGYFVERRGVPNQTAFAATQKVRIISGTLGIQSPDNTDDGKFTTSQVMALNAVIRTVTLT